MTSPVPATPTSPPTKAVEAAVVALCEWRCWMPHETTDARFHAHRPEAERVAAAVVAALDLPGRDRETAAKALRQFAEHDLHGVIPFSEIANQWFHTGIDWTQEEAADWAERIEDDATALREGNKP